jgi:hypothetical protein
MMSKQLHEPAFTREGGAAEASSAIQSSVAHSLRLASH